MKLKLILLSVVVGLFWILFASYKNKYEDKADKCKPNK